jgi:hypothetical protein
MAISETKTNISAVIGGRTVYFTDVASAREAMGLVRNQHVKAGPATPWSPSGTVEDRRGKLWASEDDGLCNRCGGSGDYVVGDGACFRCRGTGKAPKFTAPKPAIATTGKTHLAPQGDPVDFEEVPVAIAKPKRKSRAKKAIADADLVF